MCVAAHVLFLLAQFKKPALQLPSYVWLATKQCLESSSVGHMVGNLISERSQAVIESVMACWINQLIVWMSAVLYDKAVA